MGPALCQKPAAWWYIHSSYSRDSFLRRYITIDRSNLVWSATPLSLISASWCEIRVVTEPSPVKPRFHALIFCTFTTRQEV